MAYHQLLLTDCAMSRKRVPVDMVLITMMPYAVAGQRGAVCVNCGARTPVTDKNHYRTHSDRARVAEQRARVASAAPPPPRETSPKPQTQRERDLSTFFLLPGAPPELITAAYRALALLAHPDTGRPGASAVRMAALNTAMERLR